MNAFEIGILISFFASYIVLRVKIDQLGERAMRRIAEDEGRGYQPPPRFSLRLLEYIGVVSTYRQLLKREGEPTSPARYIQLYSVLMLALSATIIYIFWRMTTD